MQSVPERAKTDPRPTSSRVAPDIILIGPITAGKSTIARLLAARLGTPHVSLDSIAHQYYVEYGFSVADFERVRESEGFIEAYQRWWPALAYAVERVLAEHKGGVIDLGAGHTHFEDMKLFNRVKHALRQRENVVRLLPSPDPERSVAILRERCSATRGWSWSVDGYDFIEHWVNDVGSAALATITIYTEGKTPAETCEELFALVAPAG